MVGGRRLDGGGERVCGGEDEGEGDAGDHADGGEDEERERDGPGAATLGVVGCLGGGARGVLGHGDGTVAWWAWKVVRCGRVAGVTQW